MVPIVLFKGKKNGYLCVHLRSMLSGMLAYDFARNNNLITCSLTHKIKNKIIVRYGTINHCCSLL